jgi:hypothetical protein
MIRPATILATALTATALMSTPAQGQVSTAPEQPDDRPAIQQLKLSGPRFGVTAFTGDVAKGRQALGKSAFMTQFGWQAETQIVATETGHQALIEWVFLLGGVEQSETNLSGALIAGYRLPNGVEFGVGPNLSYSSMAEDISTSMLVAAGITLPMGELRLPMNVAVALAEGGPRITTLVGWVINR